MKFCKKILNAGMLGLIIVGAFLRFSFLFIAFEYDELFTAITVSPLRSLGWIVKNWLIIDVHPPLYNVLLYVYNHLYYVPSEWWIRIPSVIFALLALWAGWRLFPSYLGRRTRWMFVGLLACSYQLMCFAPQARSYSLLLLLSVLQMFASLDIWRAVREPGEISPRKWVLWSLWSVLLCWTHYFGVAVFCATVIMLAAESVVLKKRILPVLLYSAVSFGSICLWMIPNFLSNWSQKRFAGEWWAAEYRWTEGVFYTAEFIFSDYFIYVLVCGGCLLALAWESRRVFQGGKIAFLPEKIFLFGVISVVVLAVLGISVKLYLLIPRFFIVLFPYIYLFVSLCLARYVEKSLLLRAAFVGLCAWNVFSFAGYVCHRYMQTPDNAKEFAVHFLEKHEEKELLVFVIDGLPLPALQAMFSYYIEAYYGRDDISVKVLNGLSNEEIERLIRRSPAPVIWLPNCSNDKIGQLRKMTGLRFLRKKSFSSHCELSLV